MDTTIHKFDKFRSGTPAPRSDTPPAAANDLLATLSLSSNPVTSHKPVFGHPSLKGSSPAGKQEMDGEDMDWTPTTTSAFTTNAKLAMETDNWLRPQRFFAPEKPTGLEGLLEGARIQDDLMVVDTPTERLHLRNKICSMLMKHLWHWGATYLLSLAGLLASFLVVKKMPSSWSWLTKS